METYTVHITYFMLVFIRISAFMAFVPFFNNQGFISTVKVAFAFLVSILLFPTISYTSWVVPTNIPGFLLTVTQEILIGILIGLTFLILLFGLQLAGRIIGFQMAFSMASVVDSTFGSNANVLSVFLVMLGTMLIIVLNGDHYLLYLKLSRLGFRPPNDAMDIYRMAEQILLEGWDE